MTPDKNEKEANPWFSLLRLLTPIMLLSLNICVGMALNSQGEIKGGIKEINDKMFRHLTNDEMHTPRSLAVTKPEFTLYQNMRDDQMKDIRDSVLDIKIMLREHAKETAPNDRSSMRT